MRIFFANHLNKLNIAKSLHMTKRTPLWRICKIPTICYLNSGRSPFGQLQLSFEVVLLSVGSIFSSTKAWKPQSMHMQESRDVRPILMECWATISSKQKLRIWSNAFVEPLSVVRVGGNRCSRETVEKTQIGYLNFQPVATHSNLNSIFFFRVFGYAVVNRIF